MAAPAHADDLITLLVDGSIAPSVAPGSTVSLDNVFTGIAGGINTITWIAVGAPGGAIYIFIPPTILGHVINFFGGSSGGQIDCSVPFGGPGSLFASTGTLTATMSGCTGTNPLWKLDAAPQTPAQIESDCDNGIVPSTTGTATNGDTLTSGDYGVISCYDSHSPLAGSFKSALQAFATPEFGSLAFVLALGIAGLVLVRRRVLSPKL